MAALQKAIQQQAQAEAAGVTVPAAPITKAPATEKKNVVLYGVVALAVGYYFWQRGKSKGA